MSAIYYKHYSENWRHSSPALFLDRDGVINVDYGYVSKRRDFLFYNDVFPLIQFARKCGFIIVVVTNQSGIGRGMYSQEDFLFLTNWMCLECNKMGAGIDRVYYSPFHPTEGLGYYRIAEETRKPGAGMLKHAIANLGVCVDRSIMIGDKVSDIEAARSANVPKRFLLNRSLTKNSLAKTFENTQTITSLSDVHSVVAG